MQAAKEAAAHNALAILATLRAQLGSLDRVERLLRSLGMVNCAEGFKHHPQVVNGYRRCLAT